jgi:iron complex outermembrane receptor protein
MKLATPVHVRRAVAGTGASPRSRTSLLLGCAAFSAIAWQAPSAWADEASALQEVVVVARKRAESVQDVPVAVSVLPQEIVKTGNLDDVSKFVELVPNASFTQDSDTSAEISIRGSGRNTGDEDPSVGLYRDGVYIGGLLFSTATFYDTERVEILRGPQAGLYGRNAVGGALNVITARPTFDVSGYADLLVASKDRQELRGAVNIPVVPDLLALRFSTLLINQDKGFDYIVNQDRYTDAKEVGSARLRALFTPFPDWEFLTTIEYIDSDGGGALTVPAPDAALGFLDSARTVPIPGTRPSDTDNQFRDVPELRHFQQWHVFQEANWDTEHGVATGVVSFRSAEFKNRRDEDQTNFFLNDIAFDAAQDSLFAELRFALRKIGRLSFVAGVNYLDEDLALNLENLIGGLFYGNIGGTRIADLYAGGVVTPEFSGLTGVPAGTPISALGLTPFAGGWTGYLGDSFPTTYINEQTLKSAAAFVEVNYELTPQLEVWGNARYTRDKKSINFSQRFTEDCQVACLEIFDLFLGLNPQIAARTTETFDNLSGGGGINYRASDSFLAYAKVVMGFKAGGFNNVASTVEYLPFDEEKSLGYELGIKSDWLDNRLRVNLTAFWQDRKDTLVTIPDPIMRINSLSVNAGKVRNKGLEVEVSAAPVEGLRLDVAAGYLDSKFRDFVTGGVDFSGNSVPRNFKYTLSAILTYERPVTASVDLVGFASYRNAWGGFTDNDNIEKLSNPEVVDLRLGIRTDKWRLMGFVDNAFDNRFTQSEFRSIYDDGAHFGTFAPGRTYGVQIVREF